MYTELISNKPLYNVYNWLTGHQVKYVYRADYQLYTLYGGLLEISSVYIFYLMSINYTHYMGVC
jgi:hypothetical protein